LAVKKCQIVNFLKGIVLKLYLENPKQLLDIIAKLI